jgi:DNA-binding transcriptional ArsR family regulator
MGEQGENRRLKLSASKEKHQPGRSLTPALLHSMNHPIRRQILRMLSQPGAVQSPCEMSELMKLDEGARSAKNVLPNLSYHARALAEQKVTRCIRTSHVRGSTQHFYASNVVGNELVDTILAETEEDDGPLRHLA